VLTFKYDAFLYTFRVMFSTFYPTLLPNLPLYRDLCEAYICIQRTQGNETGRSLYEVKNTVV